MSSSKEFRNFVLEELRNLGDISYKPMMGEFLLYYEGIYFGGIYDDRFMVKMTKTNEKFNLEKELAYDGAKPMLVVYDLDNVEFLTDLVLTTVEGLKNEKGGKKKWEIKLLQFVEVCVLQNKWLILRQRLKENMAGVLFSVYIVLTLSLSQMKKWKTLSMHTDKKLTLAMQFMLWILMDISEVQQTVKFAMQLKREKKSYITKQEKKKIDKQKPPNFWWLFCE